MDYLTIVEARERVMPVPTPRATRSGPDSTRDLRSAPDSDTRELDFARATVFPSPLTTVGAGALGATAGFSSVYALAAFAVDPLIGVVVFVIVLALALLGPKLLSDARTELARAIAVILGALAFGGTAGGIVVLLSH